eukprot:GILJ01003741.1.p1 GENE.GILJ01003741.1~~GILJ01003741.1.p1  ORF type:complete len:343 (+),score=51.82 GILJ01003741.1:150-1178(+)
MKYSVSEAAAAIPHVARFLPSHWIKCAVHQFAKMKLADEIDSGTTSSTALAAKLHVNQSYLYRMLRALSYQDLVVETSKDTFELTVAGELFISTHPMSMRDAVLLECGPVHESVWRHFDAILRGSSRRGYELEYGVGVWEYLDKDAEHARVFDRAMTSFSNGDSHAIADVINLEGVERIVDVGGGHGLLAACLLAKFPSLRAVVQERPSVVETAAHEKQGEKMGVADRLSFEEGDMFREVLSSPAYIMKHIIHDYNDEQSINILRVIHQAAPEGARLFLGEILIDNRTGNFAAGLDLHMLVVNDGAQRDQQGFEVLFNASGWKLVGITSTRTPISIVEAVKV